MKQLFQPKYLPFLALFAGGLGLILQIWLMSTQNSSGFVTWGHISEILLLVLTVAYLAVLFAATRPLQQGGKNQFNFPASAPEALGTAIAAVGLCVTALYELLTAADTLALVTALVGIIAATALGLSAYSRWKGAPVSLFFYVVLCIYLTLRLYWMYRSWSSDPHLERYCCPLLALCCTAMSGYHRAVFSLDRGNRASYTFFGLAGVYFCLISVRCGSPILYLSLALWLLSDLCNLIPMPRQFRREGSR